MVVNQLPLVKRIRPTMRRIRALEENLRVANAVIQRWQEIASLAERVRMRYHAPILAAVFARKDPSEPVDLDEVDHAAISSAAVALDARPGQFSFDGGDLGRGSGSQWFRVDVAGVAYCARRT